MKSSDGGSAGCAGEEVDREVERAPPGVDRRRAAAVGRAEGGEHERRLGRGGEVRRRPAPGRRSRARRPRRARRSTGPPAASGRSRPAPPSSPTAASSSRVTSPTGRSGVERDAARAPVAVLGERLVRAQVERDDERAGAVGRGQRAASPSRARSAAARRAGAAARAARASTASLPSTCVWACSVSHVARPVLVVCGRPGGGHWFDAIAAWPRWAPAGCGLSRPPRCPCRRPAGRS